MDGARLQTRICLALVLDHPVWASGRSCSDRSFRADFKGARKLHSPGAIFDLEKAIGKEATVYQRIPKSGTGKISVSMDKMLYEIDASSLNGDEIESFSQVLISKKIDDKTLAVTPVGTP